MKKEAKERCLVRSISLEEIYQTEKNYTAQIQHYRDLGWIEKVNGKEGLRDKKGNFYPVPTLQEVYAELKIKESFLEYKATQSIKRFVLVPFGLSYVDIYEKLGEEYRRYQADPDLGLYRTDTKKTKIMASIEGIWFSDEMQEEELLYYEKQQEKSELIQTQRFPAWEIHILPEKMTLPREGQGETIGDRPGIEANMKFGDYNRLLKGEIERPDGKPIRDAEGQLVYRGESGLTPEVEAALAFVQLRENKQVLHAYSKKPNDACCVLSGCLTKKGNIPFSFFYRYDHRVYLFERNPDVRIGNVGFVSSVKVC